jgi:GNAT superfamily N-acetyltransferase
VKRYTLKRMSTSYVIRLLQNTDYVKYYPLINEFRATTFTESEFIEYMNALSSNIHIWIIEYDGKLVATTTVIYEPKLIFNRCTFAHIEDVCVLKEYQKNGYGSILLQHVIQQAKEKKCYKATLVCNESVMTFYLKNNFEKRGVQCSMLL